MENDSRQHMASGYQRNEFGFGPYKAKHIHIDCVKSPLSGLRKRFGSKGIFIFLHTGDISGLSLGALQVCITLVFSEFSLAVL